MDRNETIKLIKAALQKRSGKTWSVTGGRGTAWGWITIDAPPARRTWQNCLKAGANPGSCERADYEERDGAEPDRGHTSPAERAELGQLLGFDKPVHHQGVSIAASSAHYREYIDRAEGRISSPEPIAQPYWD